MPCRHDHWRPQHDLLARVDVLDQPPHVLRHHAVANAAAAKKAGGAGDTDVTGLQHDTGALAGDRPLQRSRNVRQRFALFVEQLYRAGGMAAQTLLLAGWNRFLIVLVEPLGTFVESPYGFPFGLSKSAEDVDGALFCRANLPLHVEAAE